MASSHSFPSFIIMDHIHNIGLKMPPNQQLFVIQYGHFPEQIDQYQITLTNGADWGTLRVLI